MRNGIKTTEFWIGVIGTILVAVQTQLWPDAPFPLAAFGALVTWVVARFTQKAIIGWEVEGKRAYQTSEFWLSIGYAVIKYVWPDCPDYILAIVGLYNGGRTAAKIRDSR